MNLARIVALAILAAAGAAFAQAHAQAEAQRIAIELTSFRFSPDHVVLHHGEAYVLHLANRSGGGHDFEAKGFFAAATVAPQDRAAVARGAVELDGGQTADIHLTAPAAPGDYPFHCGHFMHSTLGMKGTIEVQ